MKQLDGFGDGSGRVCKLKKTLYGLKQSSCEWNMEFDEKMKQRGYKQLRADLCVYIRFRANKRKPKSEESVRKGYQIQQKAPLERLAGKSVGSGHLDSS
jgi:hypothetical protein